ncbi:MAG: substrate-binding domain-containing protein, partial [Pseudomonadota bacterium]
MKKTTALKAALLVASAAIVSTPAVARDQINIVGSSTVFPFATAVAERFGQSTDFGTPVVESTGSGGGLKLFCAGAGANTPDITNASRRIKSSEVELCASNGVKDIVEVKVGYDGIVLANSRASAPLAIDIKDVFNALAKEVEVDGKVVANPYTMWNEINPSLPATKIEVLGPPPTSGTRDAFVELVMEEACEQFPAIAALEESDEDRFDAVCKS